MRYEIFLRKQALTVMTGGLVAISTPQSAISQSDISSFAFVQQDSSLKVAGNLIRLYGIYIPPTSESCYTFVRPVLCGPRASIALEFKISGDFVHCTPWGTNPDGSLVASCSLNGEDLSAWMLQSGWAVALQDAPREYHALERAAQAKGIGIWEIPVDSIRRRYSR